MSLSNTASEDDNSNEKYDVPKVTKDVLMRIDQIMEDTGYGKIFINIFDHEVVSIEHSVTKVFKKKKPSRKMNPLEKSILIEKRKNYYLKKQALGK